MTEDAIAAMLRQILTAQSEQAGAMGEMRSDMRAMKDRLDRLDRHDSERLAVARSNVPAAGRTGQDEAPIRNLHPVTLALVAAAFGAVATPIISHLAEWLAPPASQVAKRP